MPGKTTPTNSVISKYSAKFSSDKENQILTDDDIGRLIRKIFPQCKKIRARVSDQRCYVYQNLCETDENEDQLLEWIDISSLSPRHGFSVVKTTDRYIEFVNTQSEESCNDYPLIRTVRVFSNLVVKLLVSGHEVTYPKTSKINSLPALDRLLYTASVLTVCKGFEVANDKADRISKDKEGNAVGKTHSWTHSSKPNVKTMYHRSVHCTVLTDPTTRSDCCSNCLRIY